MLGTPLGCWEPGGNAGYWEHPEHPWGPPYLVGEAAGEAVQGGVGLVAVGNGVLAQQRAQLGAEEGAGTPHVLRGVPAWGSQVSTQPHLAHAITQPLHPRPVLTHPQVEVGLLVQPVVQHQVRVSREENAQGGLGDLHWPQLLHLPDVQPRAGGTRAKRGTTVGWWVGSDGRNRGDGGSEEGVDFGESGVHDSEAMGTDGWMAR